MFLKPSYNSCSIHLLLWRWLMTIGFFLRKNCSDKGLNLFLHSFKNIWPFDIIYRGVLINVITPSMRFLVMVWWIVSVNYCFNLFLSSLNDIWCFYIFFFLKKRKEKKKRGWNSNFHSQFYIHEIQFLLDSHFAA